MVSPSSDSWMIDLSHATKLADEVNNMIRQKSSLPTSGPQTQRHMSTARRKMTILRAKLETLELLLPSLPNKLKVSTREINQRKQMLENLSFKAGEMAPTLNMSISPDRDNLLGLDKKQNDVMDIADGLDNNDLVGFQRKIMKEQDKELDKLEEAVVSTKHIALAVNEELGLHTKLIENLDVHADSTESHLQRLQRNLAVMNRKTKGGCSSIILLILAIVVLITVMWALLKYL